MKGIKNQQLLFEMVMPFLRLLIKPPNGSILCDISFDAVSQFVIFCLVVKV